AGHHLLHLAGRQVEALVERDVVGHGASRWPFRNTPSMSFKPPYSSCTPPVLITFSHFSVSSAMTLPNSFVLPARAMPPSSAGRAWTLGPAKPALPSLLILSISSGGVPFGTLTPKNALAS